VAPRRIYRDKGPDAGVRGELSSKQRQPAAVRRIYRGKGPDAEVRELMANPVRQQAALPKVSPGREGRKAERNRKVSLRLRLRLARNSEPKNLMRRPRNFRGRFAYCDGIGFKPMIC